MILVSPDIIKAALASTLLAISNFQEPTSVLHQPSQNFEAAATDSATVTILHSPSSTTTKAISSPTENYLPRRLYPGTYGQFCGPTPEVEVKQSCTVHGWHSDDPMDKVDEACERHDIAYCHCEDELLSRRQAPKEDLPMLSSMAALRFATKPALTRVLPVVDNAYFDCINKADRDIIKTGIQVRSDMQRSGCSTDPSLAWFCDLGQGTLRVFEQINLDIFLKDLDFDDHYTQVPLQDLEKRRQLDLSIQLKQGKNLAEAASSGPVQEVEQEMLQRLLLVQNAAGSF